MFRTNGSTASTVAHLYALGLPQDYYRRLEGRLSRVTVEDTAAVAARFLTPDAVRVIAVGDRSVTEDQLASLGLGPVALRAADGLTPAN
jgi:zinc protease